MGAQILGSGDRSRLSGEQGHASSLTAEVAQLGIHDGLDPGGIEHRSPPATHHRMDADKARSVWVASGGELWACGRLTASKDAGRRNPRRRRRSQMGEDRTVMGGWRWVDRVEGLIAKVSILG